MLQRLLLIAVLIMLLTLAVQGCRPGRYVAMELDQSGGQPYLLLVEDSSSASEGVQRAFSIYRPRGDNWDDWETAVAPRIGTAYGMFAVRSNDGAASKAQGEGRESGPERLGIFHSKRVTCIDLSGKSPSYSFDLLPFDWIAETAVTLKGTTLAFGVEFAPSAGADDEGPLKVARYDGQKWEELKVAGPKVRHGKIGFLLQAVEFPDGARVFWRDAEFDQTLHEDVEGPRVTFAGPLMMATFNGEAFVGEPRVIADLPRGDTDVWVDGDRIRVLLQRRDKNQEPFGSNGPMEIWQASSDGKMELVEVIEQSRARNGLLPYIQAKHLSWHGQEYIVRSNWQAFEVWRKQPETGWVRVTSAPKGLPVYDLEGVLLAAFGTGLALVAFGAGLAYHRRRHAWTILRKVQASDIYASFGLRAGAFAVDLALILAASYYIPRLLGRPEMSPLMILRVDFASLPHWAFFAVYMVYLVCAEWLFGTTVGKRLMGLSVVADTGGRPTFWAAAVRNLIGFYERLPQTFIFVAVPMIMFGPRRQRLGDVLARTFVVQARALEVFKAQRAAAAQSDAPKASADLLPPLDLKLWEGFDGGGKKNDENKNGKGRE